MDKHQQAHDIAIALLQCVHSHDEKITGAQAFEAAKEYLVYYRQALNSLSEEEQ